MDTWTQIQLKKMELGGNTRAKEFFAQYGIPDLKAESISSVYHTPVADAYRAKLDALAAGQPYTDPDPEKLRGKRSMFGGGAGGVSSIGGSSRSSSLGGSGGLARSNGSSGRSSPAAVPASTADGWGTGEADDWFDAEEEQESVTRPTASSSSSSASSSSSVRGGTRGRAAPRGNNRGRGTGDQRGQYVGKANGFQDSEVGGAQSNSKYKGLSSDAYFGNPAPAQSSSTRVQTRNGNETDDLTEMFSTGWNKLAGATRAAAAFATAKTVEISQKAQTTDWEATAERTKAATAAAAASGWGLVTQAWSSLANVVEDDEQHQEDAFDAFVGPTEGAATDAADGTSAAPGPAAQLVVDSSNWDDWDDDTPASLGGPAVKKASTPIPRQTAAPKVRQAKETPKPLAALATPAPTAQVDASLSGWDEDW